MAKVFKKNSSKEIDWTRYAEGDALFDFLRAYYIGTGEIYSDKWESICRADIESKRKQKKTKINNKRNYKI